MDNPKNNNDNVSENIIKQFMEMSKKNQESKEKNFRFMPRDPYSHKSSLINNPETKDVENYEEFLSKELAISNIANDQILEANAFHIRNVQIQLLDMAKNIEDPVAKDVIKSLFNHYHVSFIAELKMTRSRQGFERELQADMLRSEARSGGFRFPKRNNQEHDPDDLNQMYD